MTCELIHGDAMSFLEKHRKKHDLFIVTDAPLNIAQRPLYLASRVYLIYGGPEYLVGNDNGARIPGEKHIEPYRLLLNIIPQTTICDPFMGTGTIGEAALRAGHDFIGVEINLERFRICEKRLAEWM